MLNAWNGTGLSNTHSIELEDCVSLSKLDIEVKKGGINQGFLPASSPLINKLNTFTTNIAVAITDIIEPLLDNSLNGANASG